jgi:hypothetical protein
MAAITRCGTAVNAKAQEGYLYERQLIPPIKDLAKGPLNDECVILLLYF